MATFTDGESLLMDRVADELATAEIQGRVCSLFAFLSWEEMTEEEKQETAIRKSVARLLCAPPCEVTE